MPNPYKRHIETAGARKARWDYDSKFEELVIQKLIDRVPTVTKNPVSSKGVALNYQRPPQKYYPDACLPDGAFLEVKGLFDADDRRKLLLVRDQNPGIVIRICFMRPNTKLNKTSKTTYADWCDKNGFSWCKGPDLPDEWLNSTT